MWSKLSNAPVSTEPRNHVARKSPGFPLSNVAPAATGHRVITPPGLFAGRGATGANPCALGTSQNPLQAPREGSPPCEWSWIGEVLGLLPLRDPQPALAEHLPEDSVFLAQLVDGVKLVPIQPACDGQYQELGGKRERCHGRRRLPRSRRKGWRDGAFEHWHHTGLRRPDLHARGCGHGPAPGGTATRPHSVPLTTMEKWVRDPAMPAAVSCTESVHVP